jgi:hypothetical protein
VVLIAYARNAKAASSTLVLTIQSSLTTSLVD